MLLKEKVALVSGGGTGIGKAISRSLAKNGARVAIASRNRPRLDAVAEEFAREGMTILPIAVDVRDKQQVEQAVGKVIDLWKTLHIIVNNAGTSGLNRIDDPDDARWHQIVDTNLTGMYFLSKTALKSMSDHDGRIINISSVLGKFGVPGYTAYCTTKHGMIGFTRALALEVVHRGITVNVICPGWVDTEMARQGIRESAVFQGITAEQFKKQAVAAVPIKRFLEPEEVAELVCYLASDLAKGITGQAINICGGQVMT